LSIYLGTETIADDIKRLDANQIHCHAVINCSEVNNRCWMQSQINGQHKTVINYDAPINQSISIGA